MACNDPGGGHADLAFDAALRNKRLLIVTTSIIPHVGGLSTHVELLRSHVGRGFLATELINGNFFYGGLHKACSMVLSCITFSNIYAGWVRYRVRVIAQSIRKSFECAVPDIIHCHDALAVCATEHIDVPVIYTVHGPLLEHTKEQGIGGPVFWGYLEQLEHRAFKRADRCIAVDTGQKRVLVRKGVPEEKVAVVFNAVDVKKIRHLSTYHGRQVFDLPYFIMARRLVPKNGPEIAIRAFLSWVGTRNIGFVVAGDGPLRTKLEGFVRDHPNAHKVKFVGDLSHDELMPLISRSIASIVPSVPVAGVIEATSLSALESLALGTPVIASNIGGLVEIDGGRGYCNLFEAGNESQLISRMDRLAGDDAHITERQRTEFVEYVASYFGVDSWSEKHLKLYHSVLRET